MTRDMGMSFDCQLFVRAADNPVAIVGTETPDKWPEMLSSPIHSWLRTLILLSTKLDEAAFYSQVTELFVPRGTYTAPPGLLSPVSITGESTDASFIRPCEDFFRVGGTSSLYEKQNEMTSIAVSPVSP
jgi:hypothetical protein